MFCPAIPGTQAEGVCGKPFAYVMGIQALSALVDAWLAATLTAIA